MQTLGDVFAQHADFYRERYVPFLLEEGFITSVEESEYAEGIDGFKRLGAAEVEALPRDYQTLLSEVGHGNIHFPTEGGPARFSVLAPTELAHWKQELPSFLAAAGSTLSTDDAVPFLVDDGGGILAFLAGEEVFVVSHTGKLLGPAPSLLHFFSTMFENAREHRLPFEGVPQGPN